MKPVMREQLMGKCWAFYPIAGSRSAWIPCMRRAEAGGRYCRRHGDAAVGIVLGSILHADDARKTAMAARREEAGRERKSLAVEPALRKKNDSR